MVRVSLVVAAVERKVVGGDAVQRLLVSIAAPIVVPVIGVSGMRWDVAPRPEPFDQDLRLRTARIS